MPPSLEAPDGRLERVLRPATRCPTPRSYRRPPRRCRRAGRPRSARRVTALRVLPATPNLAANCSASRNWPIERARRVGARRRGTGSHPPDPAGKPRRRETSGSTRRPVPRFVALRGPGSRLLVNSWETSPPSKGDADAEDCAPNARCGQRPATAAAASTRGRERRDGGENDRASAQFAPVSVLIVSAISRNALGAATSPHPKETGRTARIAPATPQRDAWDARPMLATAGPLPNGAQWCYEFKWDGVRALVQHPRPETVLPVASGSHSRSGADITRPIPKSSPSRGACSTPPAERVAPRWRDRGLRARRAAVVRRAAERMAVNDEARARRLAASTPASFLPFDVLVYDGRT